MGKNIIVGTRGSKLAVIQTETVVEKIKAIYPDLNIIIQKVMTTGDKNHDISLDHIGVAVFVRELEDALLNKRIDLAVHSLKDMPSALPHGLCLLAVTERSDPHDALIAHSKLEEMRTGSRIGTGSLRRSIQLLRMRPDVQVVAIRGNVDTRIKKVATEEMDGVIIAAAAMQRLGWSNRITQLLPMEQFLPAVGQGAIALEARCDDAHMADIGRELNHIVTWQCITAERAFLHDLHGGCRAPIAAMATVKQDKLMIEGMVASVTDYRMLRATEEGIVSRAAETGRELAKKLLKMGAAELVSEYRK